MQNTAFSHLMAARQWSGRLLLVLLLVGLLPSTATGEAQRLAILIAAPWTGETAMHNDLIATYTALRQRGFAPEEFLVLEGALTRSLLLAFLQDVQRRLSSWSLGAVWLSVSGHGMFHGPTAAAARPGLLLSGALAPGQEELVFWDEIFAVLQVPQAVQLFLLPDT
jgi:hypothetical protein